MVKLWRRYKPFINAGIQELISYRVNFILYRIGDVMGAFVAFYLWKAVFDSSQERWLYYHALAETSPFFDLLSFHRAWFQVVDFYLCWPAIFKCHCFDENLIWARDCRSAGTNYPLSF